ncbi:uncharacterized protein LOC143276474 isoform X1 [Babylonia areolata]|uniref:uncharacterized protein LOC143276474 isoform X1 n=1 Tax=Babylonia areolata TaxID=304850 RepID=UPI003FCFBA32
MIGQWVWVCLYCLLCLLLCTVEPSWGQEEEGNPCTSGTHTCDPSTQRCVAVNSTANYTCECVRLDQQVDDVSNICTDLPDSQILYLTTPISTRDSDQGLIMQVLSNTTLSQEGLDNLFKPLESAIPAFKGVKFLTFRVTGVIADRSTAFYKLLFSENVTSETRHNVARAVLAFEKVGKLSAPNGATAEITGFTGIFDTEKSSLTDEDDMDWCSFPDLYSCRTNSTCRDVGLRYDCPCQHGFVDDGTSCYVCLKDFYYGPNCSLPCDCAANNSLSCDRANGTCFCTEPWEGRRCDQDVDECARSDDVCGDPAFFRCINVVEGYQCTCVEGMTRDNVTNDCEGAVIKAPSPFDTDGTRELDLVCHVSNAAEVTRYEWSDLCLRQEAGRCTIRPHPSWDDGKTVTCTAHFANSQSFTASFTVTLNYPPPSAPLIEGYMSGEKLREGDRLKMTCTVVSGKPLASSVLFSCPRHRDVSPDVRTTTGVTSVLDFRVTSEEDGAVCTCSGQWKDGLWYSRSTTRVLRVVQGGAAGGEVADSGEASAVDFKWYVLFGSLGVFSIVLIVLIVVICRKQGQNQYKSSRAVPNSRNASAGTSTGLTTSMGTYQTSLDELSPLDARRSLWLSDNPKWGPPPQRHVWRHLPSPPRSASAEYLNPRGLGPRTRDDSQRHHRRGSQGSEVETYAQISAGVLDSVVSGQSSDMYLHPTSGMNGMFHGYLHPTARQPRSQTHRRPTGGTI